MSRSPANSYRRDDVEQPLRPDEILQMFGRAGRRGLDETGFVLDHRQRNPAAAMRDPAHLSRSGTVDWGALLGLMAAAAQTRARSVHLKPCACRNGCSPRNRFFLGVEESLKHPDRSVRLEDRRRTRAPRPQACSRNAQQPRRVGSNAVANREDLARHFCHGADPGRVRSIC